MSPVGGGLAFEYMVGAAGLYGQRKADQSVFVSQVIGGAVFPSTPSCVSGCPVNASSNNDGFVFNADAMAGISYAFNPNAKIILNYRFDGYWNALRGWDASGKPLPAAVTRRSSLQLPSTQGHCCVQAGASETSNAKRKRLGTVVLAAGYVHSAPGDNRAKQRSMDAVIFPVSCCDNNASVRVVI